MPLHWRILHDGAGSSIQKVVVLDPPYDTGTTLRWEKLYGMPANASFEVVYRDTDEPDWTSVIPVGTVTTIQLPLSKDNVIFGVRSVDPLADTGAQQSIQWCLLVLLGRLELRRSVCGGKRPGVVK